VVRVGTSKGSTISLWLQYIRGISYRGPTERKKKKEGFSTTYCHYLTHPRKGHISKVSMSNCEGFQLKEGGFSSMEGTGF
jgi:hypothetical protein